jgi:hypothetical protein
MQAPSSHPHIKILRGGCMCGAVAYSTSDDFKYAGYCHCTDCQQFSGSLFNAFGGVPRESFVVTKGQEHIKRFTKNEESILCFCAICGSSLFAEKPKKEMIHIRLGSLRDHQSLAPQFHAFVQDKAPWYEITDGLPQYDFHKTT